eukprot:Hpha_TRINITY_DN9800_c0_g1::TRINITY_DN9800_c0_g1_i1::g.81593::m.81593
MPAACRTKRAVQKPALVEEVRLDALLRDLLDDLLHGWTVHLAHRSTRKEYVQVRPVESRGGEHQLCVCRCVRLGQGRHPIIGPQIDYKRVGRPLRKVPGVVDIHRCQSTVEQRRHRRVPTAAVVHQPEAAPRRRVHLRSEYSPDEGIPRCLARLPVIRHGAAHTLVAVPRGDGITKEFDLPRRQRRAGHSVRAHRAPGRGNSESAEGHLIRNGVTTVPVRLRRLHHAKGVRTGGQWRQGEGEAVGSFCLAFVRDERRGQPPRGTLLAGAVDVDNKAVRLETAVLCVPRRVRRNRAVPLGKFDGHGRFACDNQLHSDLEQGPVERVMRTLRCSNLLVTPEQLHVCVAGGDEHGTDTRSQQRAARKQPKGARHRAGPLRAKPIERQKSTE